jgi:hypothetical protein
MEMTLTKQELDSLINQTEQITINQCLSPNNLTLSETMLCNNLLTRQLNSIELQEQAEQERIRDQQEHDKEYNECLIESIDRDWCNYVVNGTEPPEQIPDTALPDLTSLIQLPDGVQLPETPVTRQPEQYNRTPLEQLTDMLDIHTNTNSSSSTNISKLAVLPFQQEP